MREPTITAGLAGGGVAGLCWWTYSGPYRWLAELQLDTFGQYYPFWTFLILSIGIWLGVDQVWGLVQERADFDVESSAPAWRRELELQSGRFYQMFAGGIVLLVIGGCSAWTSMRAEKAGLCRIPLDLLESGRERTSNWVQVSGTLLWDDSWEWSSGMSTVYYVPIVSGTWKRGDPVTVFARFTASEAEAAGDYETVKGTVEQTGMPGPIEAAFEDYGPRPAGGAFVINANATPSSNLKLDIALLALGVGLIGGSLCLYQSLPTEVDLDAAFARHERDNPPASTRHGSAPTNLMDWAPPDAESGCDAEVQAWLKAHNMEGRR